MNVQNKLYTIQFSHHTVTDSQPVPEQWLWSPQVSQSSWISQILSNSQILHNSQKKTKLPEKFELLEKREQELTTKRNKDSCPPLNPYS